MTTPVGSIKLDLTIDGSGLPREVLESITRAMAPALEELHRKLNQVEHDYDQAGREAEKSGAKQTAATKAVDGAVENLGNQYVRTRAKADESARVQAASMKLVTKQIEAQARAWDKFAAAKAAAAAVPTPDGPSGGSGGGRGGSGGGGRGGRGGGGGGGLGGFLFNPLVLNGVALAASAFPAAATATANLAGAVQQLAQAGALLPAAIGTAVASVGTLKLGLVGVQDAFTAAWKAAASGDPKDIKKAADALKGLAPSAQAAITASIGLRGEFDHLQRDIVQQNIFEGLDKSITDLTAKSMPTLERGLDQTSRAWNNTFKELGRVGGLDSTQGFLDKIFGNTADAQNRANAAIDPLVHAFGELTAEGSDFIPKLADGLGVLSTRFDDFITKSVGNGDLDRWIQEGIDAASNLGESFLNIGKIITDITGAAGGDGGFLKWLSDATGQLHAFLSSDEGQEKLTKFFADGKQKLDEWLPVLRNLADVALQVLQGFQQWGDVILPVIAQISGGLAGMPDLVTGVVTAFLAWRTISGVTDLLGNLEKIDGKLGSKGGSGILGKLGSGLLIAGGAGLIGDQLLAPTNPDGSPGSPSNLEKLGGLAANVGGGALAGAQVGGPLGAAVGATIGAAVSLFEAVTNQIDVAKAKMDKYDDEHNPPPEINPHTGLPVTQTPLPPAPPSLSQQLQDRIARGGLPGFTLGPNGQILDSNGNPVNVSGLGPAVPGALPPPPNLPPPRLAGPNANGTIAPTDLGGLLGAPAGPSQAQQQLDDTNKTLDELRQKLANPLHGQITIDDPSPGVIERIRTLGVNVVDLRNQGGKVIVDDASLGAALQKTTQLKGQLEGISGRVYTANVVVNAPPQFNPNPGQGFSPTPHRAGGGVFPGYAPGVDSILSWVSPGEGVLIPEAVRGIGGAAGVYAINSMFRKGLSRRGYAGGGVIGFDGGGVVPDIGGDNSVTGLLVQIRDLLAGKGGGGPLAATAASVGQLAQDSKSTTGATTGPFGTPIKPHNRAYDAAAAAISALGGDPEKFLGADPATLSVAQGGLLPAGTGGGLTGGNTPSVAAALVAFAHSGSLADVQGVGLGANDSVITAITAARNKKKGGLTDDAIGELIQQSVGGPGFTGVLDTSNSALAKSLASYNAKLAKGMGMTGVAAAGGAGLAGGLPTAPGLPGADIATAGNPVPVYIVGAPAGQLPLGAKQILGAGAEAAGQAGSNVAGDVLGGVTEAFQTPADKRAPNADLTDLVRERNPNALASALGFNVEDFTRQGGQAGDLTGNDGAAFDASGRLFSDTASLIDRTFTSLNAQLQAMREQLTDVIKQVADKLNDDALQPIIKSGIQAGLEDLKDSVSAQIGTSLGTAAAPPIADAVSSAVASLPIDNSGAGGGDLANPAALAGALFASGGGVSGGQAGKDSVPALLMPDEWVLNTRDVARMGGFAGVSTFLAGLHRRGGIQHFATGGGVIGNDTVGADFFGVSQVPILGAIVNLLVRVLLQVIGVQIEVRDTLNEMTDSFRQFRGDTFKAFDAQGRLLNDTSGLIERSSSSEETAADERIRILKIVIQALIKYIIEKVIVPIAKAVANSAISAGGAAAGAATNTGAPGAGGIVSSLIDSAGSAGVDIAAEVGTDFALAISEQLINVVAESLQSQFPDLVTGVFSGVGLATLFDPLSSLLTGFLGAFTALLGGGLFGGASTLIPGIPFDDGGVAHGVGYLPKATIAPERVLSPRQTESFDRMVDALTNGDFRSGGDTTIHAPFTVVGGRDAGEQARDRLVKLMRR